MNRRTVLGTIGTATLGLAGCIADGDMESEHSNNSTDDTEEDTTDDTTGKTEEEMDKHCEEIGGLSFYLISASADPETVYDAEEDGFTDVESITQGLSEANDEYEEGMEENLEEDEVEEIAKIQRPTDEIDVSEIREKVGYGEDTYVEYGGVIYAILFEIATC